MKTNKVKKKKAEYLCKINQLQMLKVIVNKLMLVCVYFFSGSNKLLCHNTQWEHCQVSSGFKLIDGITHFIVLYVLKKISNDIANLT